MPTVIHTHCGGLNDFHLCRNHVSEYREGSQEFRMKASVEIQMLSPRKFKT